MECIGDSVGFFDCYDLCVYLVLVMMINLGFRCKSF